MAEEKIMVINLRKKVLERPRWKRSKSTLNILKDILKKQTKTDKLKIDKNLNEKIWSRSKPLTKLRLKIIKSDDGSVKVELVE